MESKDEEGGEKGKEKPKGRGSRKRKKPEPPLQSIMPIEEGGRVVSGGEAHGIQPAAREKAAPGAKPAGKAVPARPMRISEVMTEDPLCCLPDTPLTRVARLMAENSFGAIPVIDNAEDRKPLGMVTDRDVAVRAVAQGRNPLELSARDVMSSTPVTIGPDAQVEEGAALMRQHRLRRIIVVDAGGHVRGMLVQAQIARHLPHGLSGETVRDISQPPQ